MDHKNKYFKYITIFSLAIIAIISMAAIGSLWLFSTESNMSNAIWAPYIVMMTCVIVLGILLYVVNQPVDE